MTIIDKVDLAALRKADSVCFDHNIIRYSGGEPGSYIRAIREARPTPADPYATDVTRYIAVDSGAAVYGDEGGYDARATLTGFAMIHTAKYHAVWFTIASLLRAGDDISLRWIGSNNNQLLRDAHLHHDQLDLIVKRGKVVLTFRVDSNVCADNSARMIRHATYSLA